MATYGIDKDGKKFNVSIKNGVSYVAGTNKRPSVGSTIQTNGGIYKMTNSGGVQVKEHNKKKSSRNRDRSSSSSSSTLRHGSRGSNVKTLQEQLKDAGYSVGAIDGIFGPKTQSALRLYQKDKGLAVDGIAGNQTLSSLNSKNNKGSNLRGYAMTYDEAEQKAIRDARGAGVDPSEISPIYINAIMNGSEDAYIQDSINTGKSNRSSRRSSSSSAPNTPIDIMEFINDNMPEYEMPEYMSWNDAIGMASDQLNPLYNNSMDEMLKAIDTNALSRGFFGQLPTVDWKAQMGSDLANDKTHAIMSLAQDLQNADKSFATQTAQADYQYQQNKLSNLLAGLNMGYANQQRNLDNSMNMLNYLDNKDLNNWNKQFEQEKWDYNTDMQDKNFQLEKQNTYSLISNRNKQMQLAEQSAKEKGQSMGLDAGEINKIMNTAQNFIKTKYPNTFRLSDAELDAMNKEFTDMITTLMLISSQKGDSNEYKDNGLTNPYIP